MKKKYDEFVFGTTNTTNKITVVYEPLTDSISIKEAKKGTLRSEISYKRKSGKTKIVTSVYGNKDSQPFDPNIALLEHDMILAIDTNSIEMNNVKYSIAVSAISIPENDNSSIGLVYKYFCSFLFKNKIVEHNPEIVSWYLLFDYMFDNIKTKDKSILLLSDSDLGKHDKINEQRIPFLNGHCLPSNVKISYGSADVSKNASIANSMVSYCDNLCKKLKDKVSPYLETNTYSHEDDYIFGFSIINTNNDRSNRSEYRKDKA